MSEREKSSFGGVVAVFCTGEGDARHSGDRSRGGDDVQNLTRLAVPNAHLIHVLRAAPDLPAWRPEQDRPPQGFEGSTSLGGAVVGGAEEGGVAASRPAI